MVIRRIVLAFLVLSCSGGLAHAEWMEISSSTSDNGAAMYLDPTTYHVEKKSGLVKLMVLVRPQNCAKDICAGVLVDESSTTI